MVTLIIFILLCFACAFMGAFFTNLSVKSWYLTIRKPSWNPPDRVFAPVWSTLYFLMAVAGWLVFEKSGRVMNTAMILFFFQLLLNVIWSGIFFGLRNMGAALFEILLLWIFVGLTTAYFWSLHMWAGLLFVPYFIWVSFAVVLNYTIWDLNRN